MKNISPGNLGWLFNLLFGSALAGLLGGCADSPRPEEVQVSPVPVFQDADTNVGFVEVFNGRDAAPFGSFFRQYPQTGCRIYDEAGKQVAFVPPQDTNSVSAPPTVRMAAGHYKIVVESKKRGPVTIPLVIKAGRTAVVNLGVE